MAVTTPTGQTVTKRQLRGFLTRYNRGESKTSIERSIGITRARGKWLTRAWANDLGVDTGNSVLV